MKEDLIQTQIAVLQARLRNAYLRLRILRHSSLAATIPKTTQAREALNAIQISEMLKLREEGKTWKSIPALMGITSSRLQKLRWLSRHPSPSGKRITLNSSVNDLQMSVRLANCINNMDIHTVRELTERTATSMRQCRNLGMATLAELDAVLAKHGFALKP